MQTEFGRRRLILSAETDNYLNAQLADSHLGATIWPQPIRNNSGLYRNKGLVELSGGSQTLALFQRGPPRSDKAGLQPDLVRRMGRS